MRGLIASIVASIHSENQSYQKESPIQNNSKNDEQIMLIATRLIRRQHQHQRSVARILLLLVVLLFGVGNAEGFYSQICSVTTPVELIQVYNETTGQTTYHYEPTDQELGSNTTVLFRECECVGHEPFVCPYHTNLCAIPSSSDDETICFEDDASTVLVRNIWPLVCLWYVFLCLLCFSYKGRHAATYCIQRCFPSTNTMLVDRILVQHQHIRQHYLNFWNANNNNNNDVADEDEECQELVLKTKQYHDVHRNQRILTAAATADEDDPSTCCTICFVPLEEGDRIGAVECNHSFHVECIKGWLQRKNTCPLCAVPLATPRKQRPHHRNNNHSSNNTADETPGASVSGQEDDEDVV